jgi:hypothetical protein
MPILQFFNNKHAPTSYDFCSLSVCRLAALYLAFREFVDSDSFVKITDAHRRAIVGFIGGFDLMLNPLDVVYAYYERANAAFAKEESKQDRVSLIIGVQDALRTLSGILYKMKQNIQPESLPIIFTAEYLYLSTNLKEDLQALITAVAVAAQNATAITTQNPVFVVDDCIIQLRNFLHVYLDTPSKPVAGLVRGTSDLVRESFRVGAWTVGGTLSFMSRMIGTETETAGKAAEWLQRWNDKHQPPQVSLVSVSAHPG